MFDAATDAALRAALGEYSDLFNTSTRDLQILLTDLGFYSGPIDGIWSPELTEAVRALQRELGVPETGVIDAATVQAIYERGIATGSTTTVPEAPDTTAAPATTAAPTTAAPTTAAPTTAAPDTTAPPTAPPTTEAPGAAEEPDLLATLQADPDFSTFVELLLQSGFDNDVERPSLYTVFAPTNEAFEADEATLAALRALQPGSRELADYLSYYIAEGRSRPATMPAQVTKHLRRSDLTITGTAPNLSVNDVPIDPAKQRHRQPSNGVIQGLTGLRRRAARRPTTRSSCPRSPSRPTRRWRPTRRSRRSRSRPADRLTGVLPVVGPGLRDPRRKKHRLGQSRRLRRGRGRRTSGAARRRSRRGRRPLR